jgi:cyclopropane fatty-acyl-phospholipid synthase-like methyltransferase
MSGRHAPATTRNCEPILAVLRTELPSTGTVLEIGSGTGEHAVYFAPRLQPRPWLPSDVDPDALASIRAWQDEQPVANLLPPILLDAREARWPLECRPAKPDIAAIVSINMIHIAPWSASLGLLAGAARLLPVDAPLILYGPFKRQGRHTSASNAAFDESLRSRDAAWGVRDLDTLEREARTLGLELHRVIEMPANNLTVVFRRRPDRNPAD